MNLPPDHVPEARAWHRGIAELEREAAALWQTENPNMSVFNCDVQMKEHYLRRIAEAWIAILLGKDEGRELTS